MLDSLHSRLWSAMLIASLIPLAALLFAGVVVAERGIERADLQAVVRATRLLAGIFERWGTETAAERQAIVDAVASINRTLYVVPAAETAFVIDPRAAKRAQRGRETSGHIIKDGTRYLYAVVPSRDRAVILLRPYDNPDHKYAWRAWIYTLGVTAVLAVISAVAVSFVVSRSIATPVGRVARASRELARGHAPVAVPPSGPKELRSLAESFNEMARELEQAHASERAFLLSVTHELKTPVAAVRGYAEAQRDGVVEADEAADVILAEADRLERLVQDLLDSARLSQHGFSVNLETVDLVEIAHAAVACCAPCAREMGVELVTRGGEGAHAVADRDRLVQVVRNLVENALRCSPRGGRVTVAAEDGSLSVSDEGPGLTAEESRRAFERFYLYRRFRGERPVGTGLGLSIVKDLTERMGGSVSVHSVKGRGSTFTIRLPVES